MSLSQRGLLGMWRQTGREGLGPWQHGCRPSHVPRPAPHAPVESLCWRAREYTASLRMGCWVLGAGALGRWMLDAGLGAGRLMSMLTDHDRLGWRMRGGHVSGDLRPVIGLATTDLSPDQP